jgi:hypothetical protein
VNEYRSWNKKVEGWGAPEYMKALKDTLAVGGEGGDVDKRR